MFYPIGKSLRVICVASAILKSDFLMKGLVMALFISSLDLNLFDLRVADSGSHTWCHSEVLHLKGCAKQLRFCWIFLVL